MQTLNTVIDMMKVEGLKPSVLVKTSPEMLAGDDLPISDCQLILKAGANIFGQGGKFANLAEETPVGEEWDDIRSLLAAEIENIQKAEQPTPAPKISRFGTQAPKANGSSKPAQVELKNEKVIQPQLSGPMVQDIERFVRLNVPRLATDIEPPVDFVHDKDIDKIKKAAEEKFAGRQVSRDELVDFIMEQLPNVLQVGQKQAELKNEINARGLRYAPAPKGKGAPLTPSNMKEGLVGNADFSTALRNMLKYDYSPGEILDDMGFVARNAQQVSGSNPSRFGGPA